MNGTPTSSVFWGKLRREMPDASPTAWHPLQDHCADVVACLLTMLGWRGPGKMVPSAFRQRLAHLAGLIDLNVRWCLLKNPDTGRVL